MPWLPVVPGQCPPKRDVWGFQQVIVIVFPSWVTWSTDRLTEICGMMKWEELIFPNRSLFLKGKRWRHQKASYPLQVKKEDLYQQYLLSFQVHLWWHILNTVLTNMSPNFSQYFQIRVVEEGLHLVQPVYITQVLVSYLLFPFHQWKDGRNVNKKQDFHIS